jgi:hypothetical protein
MMTIAPASSLASDLGGALRIAFPRRELHERQQSDNAIVVRISKAAPKSLRWPLGAPDQPQRVNRLPSSTTLARFHV